jgi:DNA-binding transcriptional ArsR family regulator
MKPDKRPRPSEEFAFNMKAGYLGAFSHPLRLQIIDALRHEPLPVNEISRRLRSPQPTVSKHLALLRQQGVVSTRPAGVTVYYSLADREVLRFLRIVTTLLEKKLTKSQAVLAHLSKDLA